MKKKITLKRRTLVELDSEMLTKPAGGDPAGPSDAGTCDETCPPTCPETCPESCAYTGCITCQGNASCPPNCC